MQSYWDCSQHTCHGHQDAHQTTFLLWLFPFAFVVLGLLFGFPFLTSLLAACTQERRGTFPYAVTIRVSTNSPRFEITDTVSNLFEQQDLVFTDDFHHLGATTEPWHLQAFQFTFGHTEQARGTLLQRTDAFTHHRLGTTQHFTTQAECTTDERLSTTPDSTLECLEFLTCDVHQPLTHGFQRNHYVVLQVVHRAFDVRPFKDWGTIGVTITTSGHDRSQQHWHRVTGDVHVTWTFDDILRHVPRVLHCGFNRFERRGDETSDTRSEVLPEVEQFGEHRTGLFIYQTLSELFGCEDVLTRFVLNRTLNVFP
ncbi:hypothetical protein D3C71_769740 [compost metagenome]